MNAKGEKNEAQDSNNQLHKHKWRIPYIPVYIIFTIIFLFVKEE